MGARPTRDFPGGFDASDHVVFLDEHRALKGSGLVERPAHGTIRKWIDQMVDGLSGHLSSFSFLIPNFAIRRESRTDSLVLFQPTANRGRRPWTKDTA